MEYLLEKLSELGLQDRTLFAFVSDHGEEFLEHGQHWHGRSVYGEVTNVPLVLWGSGVPAGRVVEDTVETIDLYPTLLELANIEPPERVQGESLVPLFAEEADGGREPIAFSELPAPPGPEKEHPRLAVVEGPWKLVWNRDAPEEVPEYELYHHEEDPLNLHDIAGEHPEVVERLASRLERWWKWAADQKLDEEALTAEMSAEELEQLRSLGYVE